MVETNVQKPAGAEGMQYAFLREALDVGHSLQLAYAGAPFVDELTEGARNFAAQADLDAARDMAKGTLSKLEKLKADLGGSPEIDRLIGELQLALASGNLQSIRELSETALGAIRNEVAARNAGDDGPETPQQKIERLWNEIQEIDKSQRQILEELYREGKISKETFDTSISSLDKSDDHPVGSPEWKADQDRVDQAMIAAADEAEQNGANPGTVDRMRDNTSARNKMSSQIQAELDEKRREKTELGQQTPFNSKPSRFVTDTDDASARNVGVQELPAGTPASAVLAGQVAQTNATVPTPARSGLIAGLSWNNAAADEVSVPPPPAAIPSSETVRSV